MLKKFLYFLSSTDTVLINLCSDYAQKNRLVLGLSVFLVGLSAFISGSYAISTAFNQQNENSDISLSTLHVCFSLLIGFIYAIFIILLDRSLLGAKRQNFYGALFSFLFRICMAVTIASIIAFPIEIKFMEKRIVSEIKQQNDIENQRIKTLVLKPLNPYFDQKNSLVKSKLNKEKLLSEYDIAILDTMQGKGPIGIPTCGRLCTELKGQRFLTESSLNTIKEQLENLEALIEQKIPDLNTLYEKRKVSPTFDFLSLAESLGELSKKNDTIRLTSKAIFVFFLMLELSAIVIKIFSNHREYESLHIAMDELFTHKVNTLANNEAARFLSDSSAPFSRESFLKKVFKKEN